MRSSWDQDSEAPQSLDTYATKLKTETIKLISSSRRRLTMAMILILALTGIALWFVPPVYFLIKGPVTVTRWERTKGKTAATVGPGEKNWISIKRVSRHVGNAVVVAEDGRFYQHYGLDLQAIQAAYKFNQRRGSYARGGSTITQQVVKMAFLEREKTLIRKAREAAGALLLELILPKERILEWYINLAEFGDAVYGIREGAWHYFKTKPEQLTIEQAVHLALVLPSPNRWSAGLKRRDLTGFGHKRYAAILLGMRQSGYITKAQWTSGITRGNFGRPIKGYTSLLAAEAQGLCPDAPGCPEDVTAQERAAAEKATSDELEFIEDVYSGATPDTLQTPAPTTPSLEPQAAASPPQQQPPEENSPSPPLPPSPAVDASAPQGDIGAATEGQTTSPDESLESLESAVEFLPKTDETRSD